MEPPGDAHLPLSRTLDALRRLAVGGLADRDPDARAVAASILAYIEADEGRSLDDALGLSPQSGDDHWKTIRNRETRNAFLRLAAEQYCPGLPPRDAARKIISEISSMDASRHRVCPPSFIGTIREPIFYARQAWPALLSVKYLAAVLRGNTVR